MRKLLLDVRHAWRALLRRRAYFLSVSSTLALVLGANAAIFAIVNATLLRPMPFAAGERVVQLFMMPPGMTERSQRNPLLQMDLARFRERSQTMTRFEGFLRGDRVVLQGSEPVAVPAAAITPGLPEMMNMRLLHGRAFLTEEGRAGHDVVLVTESYWRGVLGEPPLGSVVTVDGRPHALVGVLAGRFPANIVDGEVFVPLVVEPSPAARTISRYVVSFAELAEGASVEAAHEEAQHIARQLAQSFPRTHNGWSGGVEPAREWLYGPVRAPVLILFVATAFVLLIACANIANVTAAHSAARTGDLSLRVALGGTRVDVVRLQFAELLIICLAGLAAGLMLAQAAVPALLAIDPVAARALGAVSVDWRVQSFSAAAALLTAIGASLIPGMRSFGSSIAGQSRPSVPRTTGSASAARTRRVLVAGQVGLSLALLMGGAVVIDGLNRVTRQHPGFDTRGVLTAQLRLPETSYGTHADRASFVTRLLEDVRAIPGVEAASTTMNDFTPGFAYQTLFTIDHRPSPDGQPYSTLFRRISPDYFRTMRIRELRGRTFTERDTLDAPTVAVISRLVAEQLFPGDDPVGRVIRRTAPDSPAITIVGIVDDVCDAGFGQRPAATLYLPWSQSSNNAVPIGLVIRTSLDPSSLAAPVRDAVARIDPALPLRKVQPLEAFLQESLAPERFRATVLSIVAALGLALAALGIYGVTYRGVVNRTREFAIRLALGSDSRAILGSVVREMLKDVAAGAALGLLGGLMVCKVLERSMEHVGSVTAGTAGASLGVLLLVATAAAVVPALRVFRVDPAEALRV